MHVRRLRGAYDFAFDNHSNSPNGRTRAVRDAIDLYTWCAFNTCRHRIKRGRVIVTTFVTHFELLLSQSVQTSNERCTTGHTNTRLKNYHRPVKLTRRVVRRRGDNDGKTRGDEASIE